ncbi:MAG TPA: purine-nucleoside phosphorylase, partial [Spirochaetia bacterium]|nr:purine-nucleoside phosphorylase [Spirochaetia bacterium]
MRPGFRTRIDNAVASIEEICGGTRFAPQIGVILGSGLSSIADSIGGKQLPFADIAEFPTPTVAGHRGALFISNRAVVMAGLFHFYEGHSIDDVVLPVFVMKRLGIGTLLVTNASGG